MMMVIDSGLSCLMPSSCFSHRWGLSLRLWGWKGLVVDAIGLLGFVDIYSQPFASSISFYKCLIVPKTSAVGSVGINHPHPHNHYHPQPNSLQLVVICVLVIIITIIVVINITVSILIILILSRTVSSWLRSMVLSAPLLFSYSAPGLATSSTGLSFRQLIGNLVEKKDKV